MRIVLPPGGAHRDRVTHAAKSTRGLTFVSSATRADVFCKSAAQRYRGLVFSRKGIDKRFRSFQWERQFEGFEFGLGSPGTIAVMKKWGRGGGGEIAVA